MKIDGSFVKDIDTNTLNRAMVGAINDIAHELGKKTIAELVKSEAILEALMVLEVDLAQGFHLGKPQILETDNV